MKTARQNPDAAACKAWLLPFGKGLHVAIGEFEMVHILTGRQRYTRVPCSPVWCRFVFAWCGRPIPLFDLDAFLNPVPDQSSIAGFSASDTIAIVAYEDRQGSIQYGGFILSALPFARVVSDNQMCDYPSGNIRWNEVALSCFKDPDAGAVPILDIAHLFCATNGKAVLNVPGQR